MQDVLEADTLPEEPVFEEPVFKKTRVNNSLRQLLDDCKPQPNRSFASATVEKACWHAMTAAEDAAWDVFQDSMLQYGQAPRGQIDLLEIYAGTDSRLTHAVIEAGGKARRFTRQDGDLSTIEGQRALYDAIQQSQQGTFYGPRV